MNQVLFSFVGTVAELEEAILMIPAYLRRPQKKSV